MRFILFLFAIALLSAPTLAAESGAYPKEQWDPYLLEALEKGPSILSKDEVFDVVPPPADSSDVTKAEIEGLHKYTDTERTAEAIEKIQWENTHTPLQAFIRDGLFDVEKNEEARKLLVKLDEEVGYFILREKMKFARLRPNQVDSTLETVIPNPKHASYPSGHAGQSWMTALLLTYLDPKKEGEPLDMYGGKYMKEAFEIGQRREIAGVHYPSDSWAGRKLADQVFQKLMQNPEFVMKLDEIKKNYVVKN